MTKAFNNLINKTKLISAGDYSILPETKDYKEFVQLLNYFHIMKENIQFRETEIQILNVELECLNNWIAPIQYDPEIAKIFIKKVYNTKAVTIEEF